MRVKRWYWWLKGVSGRVRIDKTNRLPFTGNEETADVCNEQNEHVEQKEHAASYDACEAVLREHREQLTSVHIFFLFRGLEPGSGKTPLPCKSIRSLVAEKREGEPEPGEYTSRSAS